MFSFCANESLHERDPLVRPSVSSLDFARDDLDSSRGSRLENKLSDIKSVAVHSFVVLIRMFGRRESLAFKANLTAVKVGIAPLKKLRTSAQTMGSALGSLSSLINEMDAHSSQESAHPPTVMRKREDSKTQKSKDPQINCAMTPA